MIAPGTSLPAESRVEPHVPLNPAERPGAAAVSTPRGQPPAKRRSGRCRGWAAMSVLPFLIAYASSSLMPPNPHLTTVRLALISPPEAQPLAAGKVVPMPTQDPGSLFFAYSWSTRKLSSSIAHSRITSIAASTME